MFTRGMGKNGRSRPAQTGPDWSNPNNQQQNGVQNSSISQRGTSQHHNEPPATKHNTRDPQSARERQHTGGVWETQQSCDRQTGSPSRVSGTYPPRSAGV